MAGELARSARVERQDLYAHRATEQLECSLDKQAAGDAGDLARAGIGLARAFESLEVEKSPARLRLAHDLVRLPLLLRQRHMQALEKSIARAATYRLGAAAPPAVEGGRSNAHGCRLES